MDIENNIKKIMEKKKAVLNAKREEQQKQKEQDRQKDMENFKFSMTKLEKLSLVAGETFMFKPLHAYSLGKDLLIHSSTKTESGDKKYCHQFCIDTLVLGTKLEDQISCPTCKLTGYEYEGKPVTAVVGFVYNSVGAKREFKDKEGGNRVFHINPAQTIEIQSDGKGATVLQSFKMLDEDNLYERKIWGVKREKGVATKKADGTSITRGGGFVSPEVLNEATLLERLGREGFSAEIPEYAQRWADNIKEVLEKSGPKAAKNEVFRYILTTFDNAEQVVDIINKLDKNAKFSLPEKETKESAEKTGNLFN